MRTHTTSMSKFLRQAIILVAIPIVSGIVTPATLRAADGFPAAGDDPVAVDPATAMHFQCLGHIAFIGEDRRGTMYYESLRGDLPDMVVPVDPSVHSLADAAMLQSLGVPPGLLLPPMIIPPPRPPAPESTPGGVVPTLARWYRDHTRPGIPWQVSPLVGPDGYYDLRYYRVVPVIRDDSVVRRDVFEVYRLRWPKGRPIPPTPPVDAPIVLPDGDVQPPYCPTDAWPDVPQSFPNDNGNSHKDIMPVQPGGGGGGRPMVPDMGPLL